MFLQALTGATNKIEEAFMSKKKSTRKWKITTNIAKIFHNIQDSSRIQEFPAGTYICTIRIHITKDTRQKQRWFVIEGTEYGTNCEALAQYCPGSKKWEKQDLIVKIEKIVDKEKPAIGGRDTIHGTNGSHPSEQSKP